VWLTWLHTSGVSPRTSALVMRAFEADLILLRARNGMAISRVQERLRGKLSNRQQKELRGMHDTGGHLISGLAELFTASCSTICRTLG